jgi:3-isopropylmalate/(R)-2-methylmalate dehydratase large subunit
VQDGSAPAFEMLRQRGLAVRRPERAFATPDHYVPTGSRSFADIADPEKRAMAQALKDDSAAAGIRFFGLTTCARASCMSSDPEQG